MAAYRAGTLPNVLNWSGDHVLFKAPELKPGEGPVLTVKAQERMDPKSSLICEEHILS